MGSLTYAATGQWAHPQAILGYILGGSILLIALAVFAGWKIPFNLVKEFRDEAGELLVGETVTVEAFEVGQTVKVSGVSKGKGFQGTIKRHNFAAGPKSHGSHNVRAPGSIGASATPSRVFKGIKGPGRMGGKRVTQKGLTIVELAGIGPGPMCAMLLADQGADAPVFSDAEMKAIVAHACAAEACHRDSSTDKSRRSLPLVRPGLRSSSSED